MQEPGTIVGERYKLVRKVGEGGLAAVWEAEHLTLGSKVAIKFLHRTGPMQSEASQRFLREARVAASVRHRNVVSILDFGFADGEIPYMVMEFLHGRSLGDHLQEKGRLSFEEATGIVAGMLRGLTAVHAAGLVHRDIKPDNVFLADEPDEGLLPKIVDFGLSRRAGRSDMTAEGTLMGTPQYMAPEQASGSTDLDARVDLYATGVVLYELVSGVVPFDSDSLAELLSRVMNEQPTPLRKLVPEVPEKLAFVVETAMAKDREHRFIDARAMRNSLLDSGLYAGADPPSGLIQRPSIDEAEAEAIGVAETVLREPSGKTARISGEASVTGRQRRLDPSTKRSLSQADEVAVFAVARDDDAKAEPTGNSAKKPSVSTKVATAKAAEAEPPRSGGGAGGVIAILLALAVIGVGAAYLLGALAPYGFAPPGGMPDANVAEGDASTAAIDEAPADGGVETALDAGSSDDAWTPPPDAGAEPALDAGDEEDEEPAHPTKRTGRRPRPTKRHPVRRPVRRRR
jgi:serine/threonine-protein kinase